MWHFSWIDKFWTKWQLWPKNVITQVLQRLDYLISTLAIEKIKEASIKKIFIKVFGEDGSAKSLLVDERMTVSQVRTYLDMYTYTGWTNSNCNE